MATSLRAALLRRLLWPLIGVSALGGAISYVVAQRFANETYDQWLLDSARSLAQEVGGHDGTLRIDLPASAVNMLVWDALDTVLFRIDGGKTGLVAGERALPLPDPAGPMVQFYDTHHGGMALRAVRVMLRGTGAREDVSVTVAETLNKRHRLAERILLSVLLPEAVLVLLTLWLVRRGIRQGLSPIARLEHEVQARDQNDLTPLRDDLAPGELLPFTRAINDLLARLDLAIGLQRRFIADAAHQLRTPLAALKVEVEHAIREKDPDRHAAALGSLKRGIDRISRLSNQLLLLARAEQGIAGLAGHDALDLSALAQEVSGAWVPRSLAAGIDLGFEADERQHPIRGDAALLGELLNNLLDNALRYAGKGSRVTVRVADGPVLEVEDDGPGIPADARNAALERFNRLPASPGDGSGLGLGIAQDIAQAHGAVLELADAPGGGLRVRVDFRKANGGHRDR